ncbi:MAG TPA: anthranilate phosphoribosyltransferase [Thermoanaerobaculaceae bacterium]|nr:anthranilate phosphoribosyltransferase [Thermoanaerobaculaceae bacterium]
MIRDVLEPLLAGEALPSATMEACFAALMAGEWSEPEQAAFLVALRAKGETPGEVAAAARVLRGCAIPVASRREPLIDTCGTGGDGAHTLNISTGAALVAAACGVAVAKHGNRSVSSRCGSADVLEALGVPLELPPERLGELLDAQGFAFLFAPRLHPAMRAVMPVRRALGVRTVFNLLGPIANPAGVRRQVVGVYGAAAMRLVAGALAELGAERAWVVHGEDGLDELSVCAPTRVLDVRGGDATAELTVEPERLGIRRATRAEIAGGDAAENAARLRSILAGAERSPAADAVALNAAAALVVAGAVEQLGDGLRRAQTCLAEGAALRKLEAVVAAAKGMQP